MSRIPPHWRRAPLVLLHHRPVLFAVAFGAFLVALASASAPFFSAAAGSAALKEKLHEVTPLAAGLEIEYQYPGAGYRPRPAEAACGRRSSTAASAARSVTSP